MDKISKNTLEEYEWNKKFTTYEFAKNRDIDINNLYERAHSEMSLQQSKRDQIINIYLAICTFIVPFSLGNEIDMTIIGLLFVGVACIVGIFSFIVLRYRIYKEIYWMCCQTLTVLQNFNQADIDKSCVQSIFYNCIKKRGTKYLIKREIKN